MKILFLQEYIRENHMKKENGHFKNVFYSTKGGQLLRKLIEGGLDLKRGDYYIDYAFNLVPEVIQRDKYNKAIKYKQPKQSEANEEYKYLYQKIVKEKPDIIVPSGNLGCKALLGKAAISKLRGVPEKVTVTAEFPNEDKDTITAEEIENKITDTLNKLRMAEEELETHERAYPEERMTKAIWKERELLEAEVKLLGDKLEIENNNLHQYSTDEGVIKQTHECWVLPMYSMEYMLVNPSIQNMVEADFVTLRKFVEEGEKAFQASEVEYEFVTTIERVRDIFNKDIVDKPIVAWDLETNTLHPELNGAKPLVMSLSWEFGQGVTIPLEHKDFSWNVMELDEIYGYLKTFVATDQYKVGANIQYDMRFLMLTKGFTDFKNHLDVKPTYWLLINQEVKSSLKLSNLAYELTDMGGYDKPLEDFKVQYVKDYKAKRKEEIAQMREDYKREKAEAKKQGITLEKRTFPKVSEPVNEVDGSDFNYEWIPLEILHPYASGDVDACLRIFNKLDELGKKPENARLRKLYYNHYPELTKYLAKVEANGAKIDEEYNKLITKAYIEEAERLTQEMRKFDIVKQLENEHRELYERGLQEMAIPKKDRDEEIAKLRDKYKDKLEFNPGSPDDKKKVLYKYTGIKLPYNKEYLVDSAVTNGIPEEEIEWNHYKTDPHSLEYIKENHPEYADLAEIMITFSKVKTRRNGFTSKLWDMTDEEGFLHSNFNSTGTATTRLSSSGPNLQNMPRKSDDPRAFDYKYPIKRMYVSRFEGGALLQLDYSSLESRILALAAGDDEMTESFLNNGDIHRETASLVFKVPFDDVTDDQRQQAKATTFGIAYGETPFSYYSKHGMTLKEAEKLFEDYFRTKPKIKSFIDYIHKITKEKGYVEGLHGFRRNLRDVYSQDRSKQNEALRQSVNTDIQGSGAFLTNSSIIYIQKWLEQANLRSKLIITVHDSIVLDCPPEEITTVAKGALYIMENLPIDWLFIDWKGEKIRYPIKADVEIGLNYNDMVDYSEEELLEFNTNTKNYCRYKMDLKKIKNYKDNKLIDEEKYERLKADLMSKRDIYINA